MSVSRATSLAAPHPVRALERKQPGAPAFGGDARPLRGDDLGRFVVRSRITCQRIAGSESSSHSIAFIRRVCRFPRSRAQCRRPATSCAPLINASSLQAGRAQYSSKKFVPLRT